MDEIRLHEGNAAVPFHCLCLMRCLTRRHNTEFFTAAPSEAKRIPMFGTNGHT